MINGKTRLAAVLGHPVSHSKSPALHNAGFIAAGINAVYVALDVATDDLPSAICGLRSMGALGASITVPHKQAVMPLCDSLSSAARDVGAVNTLEFRPGGSLVGHNTDAKGFVRAFEEQTQESISGARVVLLGAGGAARSVAVGTRNAGADHISVVARSPEKVSWTNAQSWTTRSLEELLEGCDLLVDCTSAGLSEEREAELPAEIPLQKLQSGAVVASLIYHRPTALLTSAQERGLQVATGAGMLLHQGALAFSIWTGQDAPMEAMKRSLEGETQKNDFFCDLERVPDS